MGKKVSYTDAGVDIDKANQFLEHIKPLLKKTYRKEVMGNIGDFGGFFHLDLEKIKNPLLVSSTDGVGTKLMIAQMMKRYDTIGIDLVAMSVNDVIVHGAEPLFFLDYIATGNICIEKSTQIIGGIVKGCEEAGCALIGGETAEMPNFYKNDDYDLVGFCVGIVDADKLIDGSGTRVGDRIVGIASTGVHSNGFSLVRKILFEEGKLSIDDRIDGLDSPLGLELLRPTRIYVKSLLNLIKNFTIKGIVHITGGGFIDNIPRIIPDPCCAMVTKGSWDIPPIFKIIQKMGNISDLEMFRVFNMGIGMMIVVPEKELPDVLERLEQLGEQAYPIAVIEKRTDDQPNVSFV
ncbi:MAG: phosphoribosylformylglycinamidine cyclo-ligase [Syntrophales bacterium]